MSKLNLNTISEIMNNEKRKNVLMGLILAAVLIVAGFLAYQFVLKQQRVDFTAPTVNPEVGLGMEGALCGGDKRLPCLPGNQCEITNIDTKEGVCVHVTDDPGKAEPPSENN